MPILSCFRASFSFAAMTPVWAHFYTNLCVLKCPHSLIFSIFYTVYISSKHLKLFLKLPKGNNSNSFEHVQDRVVNTSGDPCKTFLVKCLECCTSSKTSIFFFPSSDCDQELFSFLHVQVQHTWKRIPYIPVWVWVPREDRKDQRKWTTPQILFRYLSPESLSFAW